MYVTQNPIVKTVFVLKVYSNVFEVRGTKKFGGGREDLYPGASSRYPK